MTTDRTKVALIVLRMDVGGTERCIANIANHLDRTKFQATVICLDRAGPACRWITKGDVQIAELNLQSGNSLHAVNVLADALKRIRPRIAHSHNWATLLETYLAVKKVGSIAHVHGERGTILGTNPCGPLKRTLRAMVMRWISRRIALTTNSNCVAEKVQGITGEMTSPIHIIPNGLDAKYTEEQLRQMRSQTRDELGFAERDVVIGTVARLSGVKNLGLAVRALAEVRETTRDRGHLLLVGDGPCRGELEELTESLGMMDLVHFVGHHSDAWRFLAASDIFVNCSNSEGMSQSMIEAMATGLPIIATDVGDARLMLGPENAGLAVKVDDGAESHGVADESHGVADESHGVAESCGVVIEPNNAGQLGQAILMMLDPQRRESFAEAARIRHRKRYNLASMLNGYERMYSELANVANVQAR